MDDVRKIADGLSKAQRAYLLEHAEWRSITGLSPKCWMTFPPPNTHGVLTRKKLVDTDGQLLGLGRAVRAYLKDQEHG